MKYLVDAIVSAVLDNAPHGAETCMLRLDYMPDPNVYLEVCRKLKKRLQQRALDFVAKLSRERYAQLAKVSEFSPALHALKNEGFVDVDGRMTFWRNNAADSSGLVLLMGTESVEDRGGLADFYAITPDGILDALRGDFSAWADFVADYNDNWRDNLNGFLRRLFRYVPVDLLTLSRVFEELGKLGPLTHAEFIELMSARLHKDWDFPNILGTHSPSNRLKLLDHANKFRERTGYSDGLTDSQLRKLNKRFDTYLEEHPEVIDDYSNQYKGSFGHWDDFQEALLNYSSGVDLSQSRTLLFQCDFALIDRVLNIKIGGKTKVSIPKVHGSPLDMILRTTLEVAQRFLKEGKEIERLEYRLSDVKLAGCTTEEEVRSEWLNISTWAGGAMQFIAHESWKLGEQELKIGWHDDADPMSPANFEQMIDNIPVKPASASRKLSQADIEIVAYPEETKVDYIWEFEPVNAWSHAFVLLRGMQEHMELSTEGILPLGMYSKAAEITQLSNEEDFLAVLDELPVDFTNLAAVIAERMPEGAEVTLQAADLAQKFAAFWEETCDSGFYAGITGGAGAAAKLTSQYTRILQQVGKTSYTALVEQQLFLLANAFLITSSVEEGMLQRNVSCAIVPPYHPAMLEKIQAQAEFMRQACAELLEKLPSNPKARLRAEFDRLQQLSTITSAVDVLIGHGDKSLPIKNAFAYYCLYHDDQQKEIMLSSFGGGNHDIVTDESSSLGEMRKDTSLSRLFARQVRDYLATFPFQSDDLTLLFVNPQDLQPVVAGVHEIVQELKTELPFVQIRLHVLLPTHLKGGRGYLKYWLDNFFSEEDNVRIETYCSTFELKKIQANPLLRTLQADVAFVQNPLESMTTKFDPMNQNELPVSDCRFPMVYPPLPVSKTSAARLMSASQTQFRAAHAHTQLVHKIINKHDKVDNYRLVKEMSLSKHWGELLDALHDQAYWVVCVDSGIDKGLIHGSNGRIISFSTGEGPFGEYNYTVSSSQTVQDDISRRLQSQLKRKFPKWPDDSLQDVAHNCLEQAKGLDGIRLLRALNPNDYEMHNFLAFILTAQEFGLGPTLHPNYAIRTLVSLDAYGHWFEVGSNGGKQPDFLLLEIPKGDELVIHATLVECKMGGYSEAHLDKARIQLRAGYEMLSERWNPSSVDVDRRYWFAQLYRALVFSEINLEDNSAEYENFVRSLHDILSGDFEIQWSGRIFTFWLDADYERGDQEFWQGENGFEVTEQPFGQLYIQKMLRSPQFRTAPVAFLEPSDDDLDAYEGEQGLTDDEWDDSLDEVVKPDPISIPVIAIDEDPALTREDEEDPKADPIDNDSKVSTTAAGAKTPADKSSDGQDDVCREKTEPEEEYLADIRVLIGEDTKTREKVYWEYGHALLPNRHILISGNSGTGKTYLIQSMMLELARAGISCMVFDYTDGFTESKLEPEFRDFLGSRIVEFPVYHQPFPINPFKRHEIEIAGRTSPQKSVDVAERIKSVFQAVYDFGDQQASAIYKATRDGLDKHGEKMNLNLLREELKEVAKEIPNAKTVLSKIEPLVDREPFDSAASYDWSKIRDGKGTIFIVQLSGFTRDVQLVITELILWDAWYYNVKHGSKEFPFPVILDEAQNLDHGSKSPSTKILTEGRKFGWSGWFATQFIKNQLSVDEIQRLQQSSQKIYFNPPEAEIVDIAAAIEPDKSLRQGWHIRLAQLQKGECVVVGYEPRNGKLQKRLPRIVKVASMAERTN